MSDTTEPPPPPGSLVARLCSDGDGGHSSLRAVILLDAVLVIPIMSFAWVWAICQPDRLTVAAACTAALGSQLLSLLGIKLGQNNQENKP